MCQGNGAWGEVVVAVLGTSCTSTHREDSDARIINDAADVKLRSFNTKVCLVGVDACKAVTLRVQVHKVDALVSYKTDVLPSS